MKDRAAVHRAYAEVRRTGPGVSQQIDHAHHQLEFNLVVAGKGAYFVEDGHYDLVPGTLVWLLPQQQHRLMRSPDFDMWVVICDCDAFGEDFLADIAGSPCTVLSTEDAVALDRLLAHVSQDIDDPELYRVGLEYAVRSARHAGVTTAGPSRKRPHPAVVQAIAILRGRTDAPSAGALAEMCGLSKHYLGQLLTEQTGRGYVEWRNRTRLERFHQLYPESGDLLTAAFAAGFGSYTQFHRVFAEMIGSTPGEWARSRDPARSIELQSEFRLITGGPGGSTRMVCYELCQMPFPIVGEALGTAFGLAMQLEHGAEAPAVSSGFTADTDFREFEEALVSDLRQKYGSAADKLDQLFSKCDILDLYKTTFPNFFEIEDMASAMSLHLIMAWMIANRRGYPKIEQVGSIIGRVRQALSHTPAIEKLDPAKRRLLTAALITEVLLMRNAIVGAKSSGRMALLDQVCERVCTSAAQSFGLNLQTFELWHPASDPGKGSDHR